MTETSGYFVIPCRLLLTEDQRDRLERLRRKRDVELPDLISEIVSQHLEELAPDDLAEPLVRDDRATLEERLKAYRRDLRRLYMRQAQLGASAPRWLAAYITDVEEEIVRLERRLSAS
ncbi:MAG: hypothetical protein KatS3mg057_1767 [Herpetosiphonaceae bacterium]|nr:MAG: hypothetical protein KatS3mg057_1767 [Herpetosiphonaceae bacterium]